MTDPITLLSWALTGGLIYYIRGMKKPESARPLMQALFAAPYAVAAFTHAPERIQFMMDWWPITITALQINLLPVLDLIVTTAVLCTGHGNWQAYGEPQNPPPGAGQERLEFLIAWAKPHLPAYWYKFLGMAMSGLLITLPTGLIMLDPVLAFSGLFKAVAYAIGWKIFKRWPTRWGEFLTGAILYTILGARA